MEYKFMKVVDGKFQTAIVHTSDTVVVKATPSFAWAVGENVYNVIGWANSRGYTCKVCGVTLLH